MATKRIKDLTNNKYTGYVALDDSNGTGKFPIDDLLNSVAPEFDPVNGGPDNDGVYPAGYSVTYQGKQYTFKVDHSGGWDAGHVDATNTQDYIEHCPAATKTDLVAGNNIPLRCDTGYKKLDVGLVAMKAEAYGMYRYTGTFNTTDALEIPITQEIGRKYRVSVDTTAIAYSLYVYKSGQSGSGRSFTSAKEFEFLAEDLTAGRNCIRVYFNTANNDSATIDVFVRDIDEVNLEDKVEEIDRNKDGFRIHTGTYSSGNAFEFPIDKLVGERYMLSITTTASRYSLYVFKSGQGGSGRSIDSDTVFEYTADDLTVGRDCVRVYFNTASSDSATMVLYKLNYAGSIAYAPKNIEDEFLSKDGFTIKEGTVSTGDAIEIPIKKQVGEKYVAEIETTATQVSLYVFKSGQTGSGRSVTNAAYFEYTADDLTVGRNCVRLYCNNGNNDSAKLTLYKVNKYSLSVFEKTEIRQAAFLGASYVTFEDWIPEGQTSYYPRPSIPDVDEVSDCWWYKTLQALGWTLFKNDSWSGTTICNTVRSGMPVSSSFVNRAEASFGSGKVLEPKPSAIFVMGGINDTGLGTDVGSCMYSGWTDADLLKVAPAFCKMLDTLIRYNVGARIIVISCNVSAAIHSAFEEACAHYGVQLIEVTGISGAYTYDGHPNAAGHQKIADEVVAAVNTWVQ